jgi:RNA polymerase sigma-70 factor, ECF subfamily
VDTLHDSMTGNIATKRDGDAAGRLGEFLVDTTARADRDRRDCGLFQRVRVGSHEAFGMLHRAYRDVLVRLAVGYTHDAEDAEDVVQEVFGDLWRIRDELALRTTVAAYLCGAVRNRSIDLLRRRTVDERRRMRRPFTKGGASSRAPALSRGATSVTPSRLTAVSFNSGETRLLDRDLNAAVEEAIAAMPPRCREVFLMSRSMSGDHVLSYAEMGHALGIAAATVRVQLIKALDILEARLADAGWPNVLRRQERGHAAPRREVP